jgi:hypothetical protein
MPVVRLTVVLSESYPAFVEFCHERGIDHQDRKVVIPLVAITDYYRLLGRDLKGARVFKVGEPKLKARRHFENYLRREGVIK